jgi:hypothetical protein
VRHKSWGAVCTFLLGFASLASATTFNFSGTFTQDDEHATFVMTLASPGAVTIATTSYANGGFAPVLSIFGAPLFAPGDPSLLGSNSGGSPCGIRAASATTGLCLDALLGYDSVLSTNPLGSLPAGTYLVVLTEQSNTPNGPDLASGFDFDGQGNFTAVPGVNNGPFVDPSNPSITDTGNWALQFQNVSGANSVPEPSTFVAILMGFGILVTMRSRRAA